MIQLSDTQIIEGSNRVLASAEQFSNRYSGDTFRMMVLSSHYRSPLNYSDLLAQESESKVNIIISALQPGWGKLQEGTEVNALEKAIAETQTGFRASMNGDFNSTAALGHLFNLVRAINQARTAGVSNEILKKAQEKLKFLTGILGFKLTNNCSQYQDNKLENLVDLILEIEQKLRQNQQFALADEIKNRLQKLNIEVKDAPNEVK